jgi:hypothetical protein
VPGTLFVADEDVPELAAVEQRIVDGKDRTTGKPEDVGDAEHLE